MTNTEFKKIEDGGGKCPEDTTNFSLLAAELKAAMPGMLITISSAAGKEPLDNMDLAALASEIDNFHVMAYVKTNITTTNHHESTKKR